MGYNLFGGFGQGLFSGQEPGRGDDCKQGIYSICCQTEVFEEECGCPFASLCSIKHPAFVSEKCGLCRHAVPLIALERLPMSPIPPTLT